MPEDKMNSASDEMDEASIKYDTIEFQLNDYKYGPDKYYSPSIDIFVNGKNLRDMVNKCEDEHDDAHGRQSHYGHANLTPNELYKSLIYDYLEYSRVPVLGCGCGCAECWPFNVAIDVGSKAVAWYSFYGPDFYDYRYEKLGKFVFNKIKYFNEVMKLPEFDKAYGAVEVKFVVREYGWASMWLSLNGENHEISLSYVFNPFQDLLEWIKSLENGAASGRVDINEEGATRRISFESTELGGVARITLSLMDSDYRDSALPRWICVSRKSLVRSFRKAFSEIKEQGFDPNHWYESDDEKEEYKSLPSFWDDPWFSERDGE